MVDLQSTDPRQLDINLNLPRLRLPLKKWNFFRVTEFALAWLELSSANDYSWAHRKIKYMITLCWC
jgi:hypothetical protein